VHFAGRAHGAERGKPGVGRERSAACGHFEGLPVTVGHDAFLRATGALVEWSRHSSLPGCLLIRFFAAAFLFGRDRAFTHERDSNGPI
jgi:hypothetical protein